MEDVAPEPASQPPKFSRYRSVRKAAATSTKQAPPLELPKLPSRYHGQAPRAAHPSASPNVSKTASSDSLKPLPGQAESTRLPIKGQGEDIPKDALGHLGQREPPARAPRDRPGTSRHQKQPSAPSQPHENSGSRDAQRRARRHTEAEGSTPRHKNAGQQEAFDILTGEADRQKRLRHKQLEDDRVRRAAARERERAQQAEEEEQRAQELEEAKQRLEKAEEERALARAALHEREQSKKAAKEKAAALKAQEAPLPSRGPTRRRPTLRSKSRDPNRKESSATDRKSDEKAQSLEDARPSTSRGATVRPTVPPVPSTGFDAPKSAVNAGTRTVAVKYGKTSATLPITPESSPRDLLDAAQKEFGVSVAADQMVLVESVEQLGLERPLRRYERVRDVLNSWDTDQQNRLLLEPHSAGASGAGLDVSDAPAEQPGDTSVDIYHSQKPGSWDKRWVTLRSDGQVLVSKSSGGADVKNICHMSDFEVYFPTARQAKRLRPPKKHCFAIKSQQKAAMFLSTENFVHFFATKDREVANAWFKAVQGWRSWYLVHEMGLGAQPRDAAVPKNTSHARQLSLSKNPLLSELGSLKPLMPLGGFLGDETPLALAAERVPQAAESPPRAFNDRGGPPVSYPRKLSKDSTGPTTSARRRPPSKSSIVQHPRPSAAEAPFAATGLLGRTYSQRQKAQHDPGAADAAAPPLPGVRPLVELTPTHREPPQHARKGHGVTPEHVPAGGLIGAATTPDQAFNIPAATTWQRAPDGPQRSGTLRERPSGERARGRPSVDQTRPRPSMDPVRPDEAAAFTGSGLLASAGESQGGRLRGRGAQSGDRGATAPMLDVRQQSKFATGSLLADVERWEGEEGGPVVDRERRVEGTVKTGEAV